MSKQLNTSILLLLLLTVCTAFAQNIDNIFPLITSLGEEDKLGLRGIGYNISQPIVHFPNILKGNRVAIMASHCFEEVDLTFPYIYMTNRGATVDIIGPSWTIDRKIVSCEYVRANRVVTITKTYKEALLVHPYDALFIAGGAWSVATMRSDIDAITLIQKHYNYGEMIATIDMSSSILINAGLIKGKRVTGSPAIRLDLENAQADYRDASVVRSDLFILSGRSPEDIVYMTETIADCIAGRVHP